MNHLVHNVLYICYFCCFRRCEHDGSVSMVMCANSCSLYIEYRSVISLGVNLASKRLQPRAVCSLAVLAALAAHLITSIRLTVDFMSEFFDLS